MNDTSATGANKRAHPRFPCEADCTLNIDSGNQYLGKIDNISFGGFFVSTETTSLPEEVGKTASFRISTTVDDGEVVVTADCTIMHTNGIGFGVSFATLDDQNTENLLAIISQFSQE